MQITTEEKYGHFVIKVTIDDASLQEDVSENVYAKLENGKTDFRKLSTIKIDSNLKSQVESLLEEIYKFEDDEKYMNNLLNHFWERSSNYQKQIFLETNGLDEQIDNN